MTREAPPFRAGSLHPYAPLPDDVHAEDLAQMLARENRYGTVVPYNVADHSVRVAQAVDVAGLCPCQARTRRLAAVLHDAAEAYIRDLSAPVKRHDDMEKYRELDARNTAVILARFGVPDPDDDPATWTAVHAADLALLATERRDLYAASAIVWRPLPDPLPGVIRPRGWRASEKAFLAMLNKLTGEKQ